MAWIAGVDGCKGGWIAVYAFLEDGKISDMECHVEVCDGRGEHAKHRLSCAFDAVMACPSPLDAVAVDMPIGLLEKGGRDCDEAARKKLGKRSRSIFSAPASVVLEEWRTGGTYDQAKAKKSLSRQSWALVPKIAEVARYLENHRGEGRRIHEAHPEVSFAELNGGEPMCYPKKTLAGLVERRALMKDFFGTRLVEMEDKAPECDYGKRAAPDDFYDALACLWTAHRILKGKAHALCGVDDTRKLADCTPKDKDGLPPRIVY